MGNILVLFDSVTGNTRRMAELVAAGASSVTGSAVRLRSVDEATNEDILWCNGIAAGSPTNMGVLSWKMKKFWDDKVENLWGRIDGKVGCAFSSSGGWGGGGELTCQSIHTVLLNFGFLVFGLPDYVGKRLTLHYGAVLAGEPRTSEEQESCKRLGRRLAEWVRTMQGGDQPSLSDNVHSR